MIRKLRVAVGMEPGSLRWDLTVLLVKTWSFIVVCASVGAVLGWVWAAEQARRE